MFRRPSEIAAMLHTRGQKWGQAFILLMAFTALSAHSAGLGPQEAQLRSDLQALNDAGVISVMTTTWPLPWPVLGAALEPLNPTSLPPHLQAAYRRLQRALQLHQRPWTISAGFSSSSAAPLLSQFGLQENATDRLHTGFDFRSNAISGSLAFNAVNHETDPQLYHLDGSFLMGTWGDWGVGAGSLERWWGPGWQTSLILSHNARPIPMIFISRQTQRPAHLAWLSWLGSWHLVTFMGELSGERTISNPRLWGMRVSLLPHPYWEIGLSRTAMWAGDGRPSGWGTFSDMLRGKDNFESDDPAKPTEPGNQLAGIDIRFARPVGSGSMAGYLQVIGEDEAGNLPSRPTVLVGASTTIGLDAGPLTTVLEFQDTALDSYKDPIFDSAYNHGIYQTGYRYRSRSIGSSFDNDTQTISWGAIFPTSERWQWRTWLSHIRANRDGSTGNNTVSATALDTYYATLSATYKHNGHELELSTSRWKDLPINTLGRDSKLRTMISYQWYFLP